MATAASMTFPHQVATSFGSAAPVKHFISIGSQCLTAALLRRYVGKQWTGPLDWIFSTPEMAADCIRDGFASLLDQSACGLVGDRVDHLGYRDRYGRSVFAHHNPLDPFDHARLVRAADRFNRIMRDDSRKVVVIIAEDDRFRDGAIEKLFGAIDESSDNATLLAIRVGPSFLVPTLRFDFAKNGHKIYSFYPHSHIDALGFASENDNAVIETVLRGFGA